MFMYDFRSKLRDLREIQERIGVGKRGCVKERIKKRKGT